MLDTSLERAEYRLLCRAVGEACRLLADGDFGAGYHCLKAGLEHAEELARSGNEWANGLAQSYRSALAEYTELTPVSRLSSSTPAERPAPPSRPSCSSR